MTDTFTTLAANAEAMPTFRVDVLNNNLLEPVGDTQDSFDAAYDDYMESHKFWPHDDLTVWEIDGIAATDVTAQFIAEGEVVCGSRAIETPWGAA